MEVSVIITALDEPYINKTIDDIVEKSDSRLKEIIVIDDLSEQPIKHKDAKIIRNKERKGLIKGRNIATEIAKSECVISVDAHVKVSENWLDGILNPLAKRYNAVVAPMTMALDPDKWEDINIDSYGYTTHWKWDLDFYWGSKSRYTPAVAGHCFGFTKNWWEESGRFDDGMKTWGGENIEFPLRTWLFGGTVEVADCWVSHWFKQEFNYSMDFKTLLSNKARVVEVWFDEYKHNFYNCVGFKNHFELGDLSERMRLKFKKQVRSFKWFLDNVNTSLKNSFPEPEVSKEDIDRLLIKSKRCVNK